MNALIFKGEVIFGQKNIKRHSKLRKKLKIEIAYELAIILLYTQKYKDTIGRKRGPGTTRDNKVWGCQVPILGLLSISSVSVIYLQIQPKPTTDLVPKLIIEKIHT